MPGEYITSNRYIFSKFIREHWDGITNKKFKRFSLWSRFEVSRIYKGLRILMVCPYHIMNHQDKFLLYGSTELANIYIPTFFLQTNSKSSYIIGYAEWPNTHRCVHIYTHYIHIWLAFEANTSLKFSLAPRLWMENIII